MEKNIFHYSIKSINFIEIYYIIRTQINYPPVIFVSAQVPVHQSGLWGD
jgi:hypothetical protein